MWRKEYLAKRFFFFCSPLILHFNDYDYTLDYEYIKVYIQSIHHLHVPPVWRFAPQVQLYFRFVTSFLSIWTWVLNWLSILFDGCTVEGDLVIEDCDFLQLARTFTSRQIWNMSFNEIPWAHPHVEPAEAEFFYCRREDVYKFGYGCCLALDV